MSRISITSPVTLANLRWLVATAEAAGIGDDTEVEVRVQPKLGLWNPQDPVPAEISVRATP